jgi:hypothetical protein
MKNPLSEIYSKQVLLHEEKTPVVVGNKELESKIGKAPLVKGQAGDKVKEVEKPTEDKKYSDGAKAKIMTKESTKSYEGAFEKLFKATLNEEDEMAFGGETPTEMESEVPTETEDMANELEDEDSTDLVSDLRSVLDKLQGILDKLSEDEPEEEMEESEDSEESEEPYEESVSMEDKGHALHGMKAGTQMMSKGNMKVSGKLKTSGGSSYKGELKDSPEPKELGDKKGSLQSKKGMQVQSSVKTGDFFK